MRTTYYPPDRFALWRGVQLLILASAAILAFYPTWRKIPSPKRIHLIFGFLFASWINFLSFYVFVYGENGWFTLAVVIYLLVIGVGYWRQSRPKGQAEQVFP